MPPSFHQEQYQYFLCLFYCYVYSGEYNVFYITLIECITTPGRRKSLPDKGGNPTRDLWDTSRMLCQLSYELSWQSIGLASIPKVVDSIPTLVMQANCMQPARCGYTL